MTWEFRPDRHPNNPTNIFLPNGTIASTSDADLAKAIMRLVLRMHGYLEAAA